MAWSLRDPESQHVGESESSVEVNLGEFLRTDSQKVVNVSCGFVIAAVTMTRTGTGNPGIERPGKRRYLRSVDPNNRPNNSLCAEGRCPVSKRKGSVQEDLAPPSDREEDGVYRVQSKPTVPPREVDLEDEHPFAGVLFASLLDEPDNGR